LPLGGKALAIKTVYLAVKSQALVLAFSRPNPIFRPEASRQSIAELQDHDVAVVMIKDDYPLWMNQGKGDTPLPKRVTFRTDNVWAFSNALRMGYGIGILPICSQIAMSPNGLRRILPDISQQEDLWLVAHEDLRKSRRIRTVFDYLVEAFKKDAEFFLNGEPSAFCEQWLNTTPSFNKPHTPSV